MRNLPDTFKESGDAAAAGDFAKALELLIWIHDNPDRANPSSEIFRRANGFLALAVLARKYEPAKQALIKLVEDKRQAEAANKADDFMRADLRALQHAIDTMTPP